MTYYERYQSGECAEVWRELSAEHENIRTPGLFGDARRVADEFVRRAYASLGRLRTHLLDLGYEFENVDGVLTEAAPSSASQLDQIEADQGLLSVVLRAWYERIGSVDFRQAAHQERGDGESGKNALAGLGMNTMLLVLPPSGALDLQAQLLAEEGALKAGEARAVEQPFWPIGGFASNCEPRGLYLPAMGLDSAIYDDGRGDVTFADELREAFRWGGFPLWRRLIERPNSLGRAGEPAFQRILPELRDGLLVL